MTLNTTKSSGRTSAGLDLYAIASAQPRRFASAISGPECAAAGSVGQGWLEEGSAPPKEVCRFSQATSIVTLPPEGSCILAPSGGGVGFPWKSHRDIGMLWSGSWMPESGPWKPYTDGWKIPMCAIVEGIKAAATASTEALVTRVMFDGNSTSGVDLLLGLLK